MRRCSKLLCLSLWQLQAKDEIDLGGSSEAQFRQLHDYPARHARVAVPDEHIVNGLTKLLLGIEP